MVAPVVEEVLYRGSFVGIGLSRGDSSLIVGTSSLLVFAVVHVVTAGVAGIVNALSPGPLLTWLRFRFDNLIGAWLFDALNNLLELVRSLSLGPSLYALWPGLPDSSRYVVSSCTVWRRPQCPGRRAVLLTG